MAWADTFTIPDQSGRLVVVTGANSGIGLGAARRLAAAGAEVILAVRSPERGGRAMRDLLDENPRARLSVEQIDLASLTSVREFAERLRAAGRPIHTLVNNAGVMSPPARMATSDGFELQFGANHLGHYALTAALLPLLRKAESPRVVTVSSGVSHIGRINFDDLQWERGYSPMRAYAQSKLANLIFARELDRRSRAYGWGILSAAAHPGATHTNLQKAGPLLGGRRSAMSLIIQASTHIPGIWQEIPDGCLPTLFAATSPRAAGGGYYGPGGFAEMSGPPAEARIPSQARSEATARRLWEVSERLTGVSFPTAAPAAAAAHSS
jgi:NAD(P)-dependent dehydrogenase (short-subunit alcohol dehydrogenase family)